MAHGLNTGESRFRDMVEQLPVVVFEIDEKARITFINDSGCYISGFEKDELEGRSILDFLAPELVQKAKAALNRLIAGNNPLDAEYALIKKDGSRLPVIVNCSPVRDSLGRLLGIRGVLVDNSRQKMIEAGLRANEAFSTSLFINSPNPILVINSDFSIRKVNPAFENLTGYSSGEVQGLKAPFPWWPLEQHFKYFQRWVFNGSNIAADRERYYQKKNGEIFWVVTGLQKVEDNLLGLYFVSSWVDITGHREIEKQNLALYEKEKQQREILEEESRMRGMFIDILAHELRTPLTPIMASTGMLKELVVEKADSLQKKLTDNIYNSTRTMARRLEELLELASCARGTFKLDLSKRNLDYFVRDVLNRFKPVLVSKGQTLIEEIQGELAEAEIDAYRLELVIIGLLSNASKFSPDRADIIFKAATDKDYLSVDVRDKGEGIAPEMQEQLFKPYHRVEQDRQQFPGLGLALAVSRQIIEAHGGKIWLASQPGRGSTFSFSIPLKRAVPDTDKPLSV